MSQYILATSNIYIFNGFTLTIPVIAWNVVFAASLPDFYVSQQFNDVPAILLAFEGFFRLAFFVVAFLMPLTKEAFGKFWPKALYVIGLLIYFASWIPLIQYPRSAWSQSLLGLLAPSITPVLWMSAIIILCDGFSFGIPYRKWVPWTVIFIFALFHNLHVLWAFHA